MLDLKMAKVAFVFVATEDTNLSVAHLWQTSLKVTNPRRRSVNTVRSCTFLWRRRTLLLSVVMCPAIFQKTQLPPTIEQKVSEKRRGNVRCKKADSEHNPPFFFSFFQPIRGVHRFTENWGEVNMHIFLDSTVVLPRSWMSKIDPLKRETIK